MLHVIFSYHMKKKKTEYQEGLNEKDKTESV